MVFKKFLFSHPSAWLPIMMSASAIVWLGIFLVLIGVPDQRPSDEGVGAHVFQLLMGGQLPIIAYFAIRYLSKHPKQTFQVLLLQFIAGCLAFAPVYFLKL